MLGIEEARRLVRRRDDAVPIAVGGFEEGARPGGEVAIFRKLIPSRTNRRTKSPAGGVAFMAFFRTNRRHQPRCEVTTAPSRQVSTWPSGTLGARFLDPPHPGPAPGATCRVGRT